MSPGIELMSRAGKTFYFATRWLEKDVRDNTIRAYNFCRAVDDIADSSPALPDRDAQLRAIAHAVRQHDSGHTLVLPLLPVIDRYPEIQEPLMALVEACRQDLPTLRIDDEQELARYAHGVAGNVGLIMYPILGGRSPVGRTYAADLGIAMQYTNIARDFREDLAHGRVYLPGSWLAGRDARDLVDRTVHTEDIIVAAVRQLLTLADKRYARGLSGLHFLSPGNRFAIRVAATCYAAIGNRVIRNGRLVSQRAVVPFSQKILLACQLGLFSHADAR